MAALARKLLGTNAASSTGDGNNGKISDDTIMAEEAEELLALVKKKAGERTPSNSQNNHDRDVDLPADYYTSAPLAIGTPGVSPKQNGAGTLSSHGDDESQGVRWGSEDEGIMMTSDEDEAEEDEDDDYDEKAV